MFYSDHFSDFGTSINVVVPPSELLSAALHLAQQINGNSPDAVQSTKLALLLSQNRTYEEALQKHMWTPENSRVYKGENIKVSKRYLLPHTIIVAALDTAYGRNLLLTEIFRVSTSSTIRFR